MLWNIKSQHVSHKQSFQRTEDFLMLERLKEQLYLFDTGDSSCEC